MSSSKIKYVALAAELAGPRPPCFTEEQWDNWVAAELQNELPVDKNGFCSECTPEFALEMRSLGRCKHEHTAFVQTEDGPTGVRPPETRATETRLCTAEEMQEVARRVASRGRIVFGEPDRSRGRARRW